MSAEAQPVTSLRAHPKAGPAIRRAKAAGGLGGFAVASLLGYRQGTPFAITAEHAIAVGVGCNLVVWAGAMLIWKRLLVAQAGAMARAQQMRERGDRAAARS